MSKFLVILATSVVYLVSNDISATAQQFLQMIPPVEDKPSLTGRLAEFDELLLKYGKEINEARNLERVINRAKKILKNSDYSSEFAIYYIEILKLLSDEGDPAIIQKERRRLNNIISSAKPQTAEASSFSRMKEEGEWKRETGDQRGGGGSELDYARVRVNILEAFVDAAAGHVMSAMNGDDFMASVRHGIVVSDDIAATVPEFTEPKSDIMAQRRHDAIFDSPVDAGDEFMTSLPDGTIVIRRRGVAAIARRNEHVIKEQKRDATSETAVDDVITQHVVAPDERKWTGLEKARESEEVDDMTPIVINNVVTVPDLNNMRRIEHQEM